MAGQLLYHPNGRDRLELARDDEGNRVVRIGRGKRRSAFVGGGIDLTHEYDDELRRRDSAMQRFREMRNSAEIGEILRRLKLPVTQCQDAVEPAPPPRRLPSELAAEQSAEEDLALADANTLAAWGVSSMLWGDPHEAYRMRKTPWPKVKREALNCLDFGAAFFERHWDWKDGPIGPLVCLDACWYLEPDTIKIIAVDEQGQLLWLQQSVSLRYWTPDGQERSLPALVRLMAEELFCVVHEQEGSDFGGRAALRILHGAWKRHGWMTRVRVIDRVRRGAPPPLVTLGEDYDPTTKDEAEDVAQRIASGASPETEHALLTPGVELGYLEVGTKAPDLDTPIESEEESMRAAYGLEAFSAEGGSLARARAQTPYFDLALLDLSKLESDAVNDQLVAVASALNFAGAGRPVYRQIGVVPRDMSSVREFIKEKGVVLTGDVVQLIHEELDLPALPQAILDDLNEKPINLREPAAPTLPGGDGGTPAGPDDGEEEPQEEPQPGEEEPEEEPAAAEEDRARRLAGIDGEEGEGVGGTIGRKTWRDPDERERRFWNLAGVDQDHEVNQRRWVQAVKPVRDRLIEQAAARLEVVGTEVRQPKPLRSIKPLLEPMQERTDTMRESGKDRTAAAIQRQVDAWKRGEEIGLLGRRWRARTPWERLARRLGRAFRKRAGLDVGIETIIERIDGELLTAMETDATGLLAWINNSVRSELLEVLTDPDWTGGDDEAKAEAVSRAKERGGPALDTMARNQGSRAFNGGSTEAISIAREEVPEGLVIDLVRRRELLDDATCEPCETWDRETDANPVPLNSDQFWAMKPPRDCEGRGRCRGFLDPVVQTSEQASAIAEGLDEAA